jgi:hypothetical protein
VLKGTSKSYPFRSPEREAEAEAEAEAEVEVEVEVEAEVEVEVEAGQLLQSFSRCGIDGPWYF